jgi:LPXTG-motif cell wall-anchored protein
MKHLRKMMAFIMSMVMMLSMGTTAYAVGETNNLNVDTKISVSGLDDGDTVKFYKVLEFNQNATDTGGWTAAEGFTDLSKAKIEKILGLGVYAAPNGTEKDHAGIDDVLAAEIADFAEAANVKYTVTATNKKAEQDTPEAGLYVALITPVNKDTIYNPVFVGADYKSNNGSNAFAISLNQLSYENDSMAKKANTTVDKTATSQTNNLDEKVETVGVGDKVSFQVKTTIPEFGNNYTKAVFKVTDQLTSGLNLDTASIKVYKGSDPATAITDANLLAASDSYAEGKAYNLTTTEGSATATPTASTANGDSYVIDFYTQYLLELDAAQPIIIVYDATVLDTAVTSVNIEDNTVTVNFSNSPTDETGMGVLKDETKHYTFDIDANLLGESSYKNTEVVKIGLDKDGKEITETKTLSSGKKVGALQGATFKLYVADTNGTVTIKDHQNNELKLKAYVNNDNFTTDTVIVSDEDGRLTVQNATVPGIRGLDAGTYYLVEETAPAGYIKNQRAVKIVINATMKNTEKTETIGGVEVKWVVKELESYTVAIDDVTTATYTMNNDEDPDYGDQVGDTNVGDDGLIGADGAGTNAAAGKIQNTQGVELPSTGGIGTTIFYVIGATLVVGAGVLLVTKRRMSAN